MMNRSTGLWIKQRVHWGKTLDGVAGLFTGHTLVWPVFSEDGNEGLLTSPAQQKQLAERLGFEWEVVDA